MQPMPNPSSYFSPSGVPSWAPRAGLSCPASNRRSSRHDGSQTGRLFAAASRRPICEGSELHSEVGSRASGAACRGSGKSGVKSRRPIQRRPCSSPLTTRSVPRQHRRYLHHHHHYLRTLSPVFQPPPEAHSIPLTLINLQHASRPSCHSRSRAKASNLFGPLHLPHPERKQPLGKSEEGCCGQVRPLHVLSVSAIPLLTTQASPQPVSTLSYDRNSSSGRCRRVVAPRMALQSDTGGSREDTKRTMYRQQWESMELTWDGRAPGQR